MITLLTLLSICWILIPCTALVAACIYLILLPQQRYTGAQYQLQTALTIGARVSTIHGLTGTICSLSDVFAILSLDDGRKVEVVTRSICTVHRP